MVTELFGPAEEDGKTSYVAAETTEETSPTEATTPVADTSANEESLV
jgi:hypothetical protein